METRKVQQVGGGTYTVSMPVDWADEYDIEAGESVYLYTHLDGSLVIRHNEREQSELATVEIALADTDAATVERMLRAAYTAGFNQIDFHPTEEFTTEQRQTLDRVSQSLTGVEVVEESESQTTVQVLLDTSEVSLRQSIIQRFITLSMHEAAIEAVVGETTEVEFIAQRDDEADRVFQLVARHLNRALTDFEELNQLGLSRREIFAYYFTARQLERVADHAVTMANIASRYDTAIEGDVRTEIKSLGGDARRVVEESTDAVINGYASEPAHSALDFCDQVSREVAAVDEVLADRTPEEAIVVARILDSIDRTAKYGKNIAECALQNSL
ncbi:PhoU domain-containing protein [Halosimplex aquaticum]